MRARLVCALALAIGAQLVGAAPVLAQQRQQEKPDSTKTQAEKIRDRLKAIGPLIKPDTASLPDSLKPKQPNVVFEPESGEGRAAGGRQASPTAPNDSIMRDLLGLEGYLSTQYAGGSAIFAADSGRLDLRDNAEIVRQGQKLRADTSVTFHEKTSIICAFGAPELSGEGVDAPVKSDSLCYNSDRRIGVASGASTQVAQGATWFVRSDQLYTVGSDVYGHDAIFTDCELDRPHYHFGAGELKVIRNDILVARDVTFSFADVPVFWFPFFVQSLKRGRRSGILTPRFGINDIARTSSSYNRSIDNVGFYWAISDYFGAETALSWQSNNYTALRGTLEYRFIRQFLAGSVTYRNYWKAEGGRDFTLNASNNWQPDERTTLTAQVGYATSTRFVRQRSIDPREINQSIDSNLSLNRRFNWGSFTSGATRKQYLSDGTVTFAPSAGLTLNSITLFEALPGDESWYSNLIWTGSGRAQVNSRSIADDNPTVTAQGSRMFSGNMTSSFSLGSFSWAQNFQLTDDILRAREFEPDSLTDLSGRTVRRTQWSTNLSYQQRLIGTSTLTPSLGIRGETLYGDTTRFQTLAAPTRIDFSASLATAVYGFWPGIGPIERIRHRLSPSMSYSYSPEPQTTQDQKDIFGITAQEQNRISIGVNQTFEAKFKKKAEPQGRRPAARDSVSADSLAVATPSPTDTGPRRIDTGEKVTILSITTDALVYDFVQARRNNQGIQTTQITNSFTSDLLRGLQFSITHDLFENITSTDTTASGSPITNRDFAPHLSRVSANFSLNNESWLIRKLGLGRSNDQPDTTGVRSRQSLADSLDRSPPQVQQTGSDLGMLGNRPRQTSAARGAVGSWNASFNYTLFRPRANENGSENQMVQANVSFQPTEKWALQWSTGYSFTTGDFTDHILTLTRQLHDWDANFDFVKTQTGNFSFQFRVQLRANPDIKLDYSQRDIDRFGSRPVR